mmetsp:Transcript_583/g.1830  ORF Transcript_583/g.1830 Transcript_583/m.1830 type:complete len:234 (-) Transcript_583:553-1254(-)
MLVVCLASLTLILPCSTRPSRKALASWNACASASCVLFPGDVYLRTAKCLCRFFPASLHNTSQPLCVLLQVIPGVPLCLVWTEIARFCTPIPWPAATWPPDAYCEAALAWRPPTPVPFDVLLLLLAGADESSRPPCSGRPCSAALPLANCSSEPRFLRVAGSWPKPSKICVPGAAPVSVRRVMPSGVNIQPRPIQSRTSRSRIHGHILNCGGVTNMRSLGRSDFLRGTLARSG